MKLERSKLLRALARAKGDLEAINGSNPRLAKKLKEEISKLKRELAMIDLQ